MEGTPVDFDLNLFKRKIMEIDGVVDVHDLHVWSLTQGKPAMTAHISTRNPTKTLKSVTKYCRKLGIYHSTIQVENLLDKEAMVSFVNCK